MARRLLGAGFAVTAYNRNGAKAEALVALGARPAATPREAAAANGGAEVVIAMVADDAASRAVWSGADGALAGLRPGALVLDCSTLTVEWVRELQAAVAGAGGEFVDAPVTGSKVQAANGELNFLVGGTFEAAERARPVLAAMGRSITHLGPVGSGATLKLINNFLCGTQLVALAEALAWLERSGLDRDQALAFLTNGAPGSPLVKTLSARMTAGDYTPNFMVQWMAKDLAYAQAEAAARGVTLGMGAAAGAAFATALAAGRGRQDFASVVEDYRQAGPGKPSAGA